MKLTLAASLLSAATLVVAFNQGALAARDNLYFDHLSWCENNKVMISSQDGKSSKLLADCDLEKKVCTSGQTMTRDRITYFAYCK